ncbi:GH-E family nuclease [Kingella negevensis]|uniref:GH-E family nuclease n=1 Tax=Kingella negevensis TaxID=1522312 RepID=UPI0025426D93|nr:GH-E family nuclease [Kingella negevensis]WII93646.1 GH-E family nuclease [Kingella negevensis]
MHSTENGRFLSETNKFTTNLERRSLRADTKRKIEANYTRLSDGSYIDNRTLKIIKPPVHYGHEYGWEHRRLVRAAEELGMNQKQFDDYVNARPQHFRLENSADNQSHKFEKPGNDDLGDIKKDMINFLNGGK